MRLGTITDQAPSVVTEAVERALREYLEEVSECQVLDLDVDGLSRHVATRLRFGFPVEPVELEADPTPSHGIRRPTMHLVGLVD